MNNTNPQNPQITPDNLSQDSENLTESLISETPLPSRRLPSWRLLLPLFVQLIIIASVPAQAVYTYVTGRTIVLQTAPVDPYDFLRGYYQVLGYDVSTSDTLKPLPGWDELANDQSYIPFGTTVYVILEEPTTPSESKRPQPWKPIAVSGTLPENLPKNQIALQGESNGWQIQYGLETYYMPEDQRIQINQNIADAQRNDRESFVVEVKVNSQGKAIPIRLWVRDQNYRF